MAKAKKRLCKDSRVSSACPAQYKLSPGYLYLKSLYSVCNTAFTIAEVVASSSTSAVILIRRFWFLRLIKLYPGRLCMLAIVFKLIKKPLVVLISISSICSFNVLCSPIAFTTISTSSLPILISDDFNPAKLFLTALLTVVLSNPNRLAFSSSTLMRYSSLPLSKSSATFRTPGIVARKLLISSTAPFIN